MARDSASILTMPKNRKPSEGGAIAFHAVGDACELELRAKGVIELAGTEDSCVQEAAH